MSDSDRPRSPFAGMADFSARPPVRVLSPDQIEQMLAEHQLYLETEAAVVPAAAASVQLGGALILAQIAGRREASTYAVIMQLRRSGTESSLTLRWREPDSNLWSRFDECRARIAE